MFNFALGTNSIIGARVLVRGVVTYHFISIFSWLLFQFLLQSSVFLFFISQIVKFRKFGLRFISIMVFGYWLITCALIFLHELWWPLFVPQVIQVVLQLRRLLLSSLWSCFALISLIEAGVFNQSLLMTFLLHLSLFGGPSATIRNLTQHRRWWRWFYTAVTRRFFVIWGTVGAIFTLEPFFQFW